MAYVLAGGQKYSGEKKVDGGRASVRWKEKDPEPKKKKLSTWASEGVPHHRTSHAR